MSTCAFCSGEKGNHEGFCQLCETIDAPLPTIEWPPRYVAAKPNKPDMINQPPHYTKHPSGVECIQITEHMGFNLGNAVKYLWRADEKGAPIDDLKKAKWYIEREISKRTKGQ